VPTYRVTDSVTGKTLKLTGDSAPTEQELVDIFKSYTPKKKRDFITPAKQTAETVAALVTGGTSWIPAGLSMGLPTIEKHGISFIPRSMEELEKRSERALKIQEKLTYQPKDKAAQRAVEIIAKPITYLPEKGKEKAEHFRKLGDEAYENGDIKTAKMYWALGGVTEFAGEASPFLIPAGVGKGVKGIKTKVNKFKAQFEEPLGLTKRTAVEQVPEAKTSAVIPEETKTKSPELKTQEKVTESKLSQEPSGVESEVDKTKEIKPSTPEDPLIAEARKYKTAEEFIKAQGTPVYHGTNYANARMIQKEGINPENAGAIQDWMKGNKYSFFTGDEKYAQSYGIQKGGGDTKSGRSFVLAIKSPKDIQIETSTFKKGMKFPDLVSQQKINPENIYIKGIDNKWYPIKEFNFFTGESDTFIGKTKLDELPIKTKSQLIDIWNKAQEGGSGTPKGGTPETPKSPQTKPAKAALDINKKLAEKGLEQLPPEELAQYPTIKQNDIVQKVVDALTTDEKAIIDASLGKRPFPEDVHPQVAFNTVEKLANSRGDIDLLLALEKSPVATQRSLMAQGLGASAWNKLRGSFVEKLKTIRREREKQIKADPEKVTKAKRQIHEETKKVLLNVEELSWNKFLKDIVC
jgi:hypothetical protein